MSRESEDGAIENNYRLQIMDTGDHDHTFQIPISGIPSIRLDGPDEVFIAGGEIGSQSTIVKTEPGASPIGASEINFQVAEFKDLGVAVTEKSKFWIP